MKIAFCILILLSVSTYFLNCKEFKGRSLISATIRASDNTTELSHGITSNCTDISIVGSLLYANCLANDMTIHTNVFDLNNCFGSANGQIVYPGSNFTQSCSFCYVLFEKLYCTCVDDQFNQKFASLNLDEFIKNLDGILSC